MTRARRIAKGLSTRRSGAFAGLVLAAGLLAGAAEAQRNPRAAPPAPAPPPPAQPAPAPPDPTLPYERELLRLAEVLGSLSFLRAICSAPDAGEWQKRMQLLLDAEGQLPARRERLAGAFNRGFGGFSLTYRTCTASAREASARYLSESETLSRQLAARFGS